MLRPSLRLACLSAAVLLPMAAYGSFGGGGPCKDFGCYFLFWGLILAAAGGIPVSVLIFIPMHVYFCNPARSKHRQALLGGILGVVAFEVAAACAALSSLVDSRERNPWIAFFLAYAVIALLAALYARSTPRQAGVSA